MVFDYGFFHCAISKGVVMAMDAGGTKISSEISDKWAVQYLIQVVRAYTIVSWWQG